LAEVLLITDRTRSRGRPVDEGVAAAVRGGVRMVQVREKDLATRPLLDLLRGVTRAATKAAGGPGRVRVFVNDRIDVALAAGAQGVHLGARTIPVAAARRVAPGLSIGYSAHDLEEALGAERDGADFVTFGPVFETASPGVKAPPRGLARLSEVCRVLRIPVFALGGITAARVPDALAAGAAGVAVVSAITEAADPAAAAEAIVKACRSSSWNPKERST
jgi:thiamine-phosphate pyrophosphorylase